MPPLFDYSHGFSGSGAFAQANDQIAQLSNEQLQIQALQAQILADNAKTEMQRYQIIQETANKVREMMNETYVNRVKTADKAARPILDLLGNPIVYPADGTPPVVNYGGGSGSGSGVAEYVRS